MCLRIMEGNRKDAGRENERQGDRKRENERESINYFIHNGNNGQNYFLRKARVGKWSQTTQVGGRGPVHLGTILFWFITVKLDSEELRVNSSIQMCNVSILSAKLTTHISKHFQVVVFDSLTQEIMRVLFKWTYLSCHNSLAIFITDFWASHDVCRNWV